MTVWTHVICITCWNERNPSREPVRVKDSKNEPCCFCGAWTTHGIFVRHDPATLDCTHEDRMITQDYQVLTPAYGRDYKNKKLVIQDFLEGKDFVLNSPMGITYCSIRDFAPNVLVNLRYRQLTMVTSVRVP